MGLAPSPSAPPHGDSHHGPLPGASPGKNQFLAGSRWPILPGLSGNRRQHHPLARRSTGYRHDCPRPLTEAGEERVARAGWGDGGERSMGDKTKARYGLLFWNRCTSGFLSLHHSSPVQPETEPPGGFPLIGRRRVPASGMAPGTCQTPAGERSPAPRSAAPRLLPATPAYNASISRTIACQLYLVRTRSFA